MLGYMHEMQHIKVESNNNDEKRMCAGSVNDSVRNKISGRLCERTLIAMTMNALVRLLVSVFSDRANH